MTKKIIAITGARSEYDLLYSVYERLNADSFFDFSILVTGPHLSETFGYTINHVKKDEFRICGTVYNLVDSNKRIGRILSIGNQINPIANILDFENPDFVIVAGDREEALSVTMICAYLNIPVLHFFGGDIAKDGNIDNTARYVASKFAHIHFVTLEEHKETLIKLGEDKWRVYVVGNPAIDRFISTKKLEKSDIILRITKKAESSIHNYCVLIQHSIITQVEQQKTHIKETLNAIIESGIHCFINYPNSDAGFLSIVNTYHEYAEKFPDRFTIFKNLDRIEYVNLLRHADFLIGNSSSGIIEVASLGLPVINVGHRQRGRVHGPNAIFVNNNKDEISSAIKKVYADTDFIQKVKLCYNPYGEGNSAHKVVEILKTIEVSQELLFKNITY